MHSPGLGVYSLRIYSLGVYSLRVYSLGLYSRGPTVWGSTVWGSTVDGTRLGSGDALTWTWGPQSGGLQSGGLQSGGLQSGGTRFGSGDAPTHLEDIYGTLNCTNCLGNIPVALLAWLGHTMFVPGVHQRPFRPRSRNQTLSKCQGEARRSPISGSMHTHKHIHIY